MRVALRRSFLCKVEALQRQSTEAPERKLLIVGTHKEDDYAWQVPAKGSAAPSHCPRPAALLFQLVLSSTLVG